jgi:hypothetical protein
MDPFFLAAWALEGGPPGRFLDAGTGSGIVALLLTVFGGGGSVLAVPLLLYVVGVQDPHVAIGASAAGAYDRGAAVPRVAVGRGASRPDVRVPLGAGAAARARVARGGGAMRR